MGVDVAQTCNYNIHSRSTMRIKFLEEGINHFSCNSSLTHNYIAMVVVIVVVIAIAILVVYQDKFNLPLLMSHIHFTKTKKITSYSSKFNKCRGFLKLMSVYSYKN